MERSVPYVEVSTYFGSVGVDGGALATEGVVGVQLQQWVCQGGYPALQGGEFLGVAGASKQDCGLYTLGSTEDDFLGDVAACLGFFVSMA